MNRGRRPSSWPTPCSRRLAGVRSAALLAVLMGLRPVADPGVCRGPDPARQRADRHAELRPAEHRAHHRRLVVDAVRLAARGGRPPTTSPRIRFCRGGLGAMGSVCGSIGGANDYTALPARPTSISRRAGPRSNTTTPFRIRRERGTTRGQPYDASGPGAGCFRARMPADLLPRRRPGQPAGWADPAQRHRQLPHRRPQRPDEPAASAGRLPQAAHGPYPLLAAVAGAGAQRGGQYALLQPGADLRTAGRLHGCELPADERRQHHRRGRRCPPTRGRRRSSTST